jgi:predicted N-formylglutamate amidohydrolase
MNKTAPAEAAPPRPLLAPDEPAPFETLNPEGKAPFLLICDHASRRVPQALDGLSLDEALLLRHIGWDIGAAEVTRGLARHFEAPAVLAGYSRLVIDCNRRLGDPGSIPEVSDGVVVPGNRALPETEARRRQDALFHPYHQAIDAALARWTGRGLTPALVSIHSFTPVMNGFERPWHIGILWDQDPRIAVPLMANLRAQADINVGDNEPYSARVPQGYSVAAHAASRGFPHVAVEIRQDLIDTHHRAAEWIERLSTALSPVLRDGSIYRAELYV